MSDLKSLEGKIIKDIIFGNNLDYSNLEARVIIDKMCLDGTISCEELTFVTDDNLKYVFKHEQECCEQVYLKEIVGDLSDIYCQTVVSIEEVTGTGGDIGGYHDSFTYTYYKLKTSKGDVTISWYGESNGYYTETPYLQILKN